MQKKTLLILLFHLVFVFSALLVLNLLGYVSLENASFLHWDAEHYAWIAQHGYEGFRVAFFPLFPLLWKSIPISAIGISIVNGLLFYLCYLQLAKTFQFNWQRSLVFLSIPSFLFFFLPYTESLFFLASTLILIGLLKNGYSIILVGLFLATLARPAFTIFLPAFFIVEWLQGFCAGWWKRMLGYVGVTALGLSLVGVIQFMDTGEWFKFFSVQSGWGNSLRLPELPLTSWAGGFIVRLDGAALVIGGVSGVILLLKLLRVKLFTSLELPREVIFSLAYLGGISLSVLLFRGGSLFSLNRFVFATPFILIVLNYWLTYRMHLKQKTIWLSLLLLVAFWLFFASYVHLQVMLKFLFLSGYLWLLMLIKSDSKVVHQIAWIGLVTLNVIFQLVLFHRFLTGEWVG